MKYSAPTLPTPPTFTLSSTFGDLKTYGLNVFAQETRKRCMDNKEVCFITAVSENKTIRRLIDTIHKKHLKRPNVFHETVHTKRSRLS